MESTILFSALSEAILYSILHGLFVYVIVKLIMKAFPELPSNQRYKILYMAMIWIFASFIISFSDAYLGGSDKISSSIQMKTGEPYTYSAELFEGEPLMPDYSKWIALIYFAGLLTQSAILLFGLFRINSIRKDSLKNADLRWNTQIKTLSNKLGIVRKISLSISNEALIPFTIGFIKPIILFPVAMINSLSQAEVEAILLHELAHIKRNDYLFNIIQRIMEMILFFNPAIWLIGKEIRREREFCCDDLVIANTANPVIYAHALLQIAENKADNLSLSLSASGKEKYTLLNRIKRLTNMKTLNSNPKQRLFTSLAVVAVCLSLAWIVPAEHAIKQQKNNRTAVNQSGQDTVPPSLAPIPKPAEAPSIPPVPELALSVPAPAALLKSVPAPAAIPAPPLAPALPFPADTNELKKKFSSPEWKKHMEEMKSHAEEMKKKFDSPEWKKHMEEMKLNAEEMKKKFDSPEWKKHMEEMKLNAEEMKKKFNSPEWKKHIEQMTAQAEEMKKKFDSPEWKKQMEQMKLNAEEMKKKFDSPEWKKQIEQMKLNAEEMKKKFDSPELKKQMEQLEKFRKEPSDSIK